MKSIHHSIIGRLNSTGQWLPPLALRLILFWEFWEAGLQKYNGNNWFGSIQQKFPFPFNKVPSDISWAMATYGELIASVLLLIGLFTRFAAMSIIIITAVATAAVHWPENWQSLPELWQGYAITDKGYGNFKLPVLFIIMALPLLFSGGGKFSIDNFIKSLLKSPDQKPLTDLSTFAFMILITGSTLYFVMPWAGVTMCILGVVLQAIHLYIKKPYRKTTFL